MSPPRRFDQAEFERILRRALELQAEQEEQHFTEADVVAAGRELGIRDELTRAAARELYTPRCEVERPADTDLVLELSPMRLRLVVPARAHGWLAGMRVALGLGLVGLAAALGQAALARSADSIILGFLAILACWAAARYLAETLPQALLRTELLLEASRGQLLRGWGSIARTSELYPARLRCTLRAAVPARRLPAHLELLHAGQRWRILSGRTEAELGWVEAQLQAWLRGVGDEELK